MPPPQATYLARSSNTGYDPATLSDDEDDTDAASVASSSVWSSAAHARASAGTSIPTLAVLDGRIPATAATDGSPPSAQADEVRDWKSFPLASAPPADSRLCLQCSSPMPLLIQLYCPLPHSILERVVYLFACPRPTCQKRRQPRGPGEGPGCVRAWRANGVWREGEEARLREEEDKRKREQEERERAERKEAASKIQLGGLVFGGGASPAVAGDGGAFNPFAAPAPTSGGAFNPFAPSAPATSAAANPFAPPAGGPAPQAAANPFSSPVPSTSTPASAAETPPAPAEQTISTWPPVASSSSTTRSPTPVYPAQYVATLYEPSSESPSGDRSAKPTTREAELARAFEAELAIRSGSPAPASGGRKAADRAEDDLADDFDDDDRRKPGKGSGGRVKKGAERASASKKTGSAAGAGGSGGGGGGAGDWTGEGYEVQRVKGVDDVFLRFQERVSREGRQIVRYDYGSRPLPYSSSSAAYKQLHSSSALNSDVGTFSPAHLPPCRHCRGPSTFELQLMPHLALTLDERYEWATCWVLSCAGECEGGVPEGEEGEAWREERVLVEWEDEGA
ncbi:hypothetical protein JCM8202v2_004208 [Rhodotorula sphaerocarpa]